MTSLSDFFTAVNDNDMNTVLGLIKGKKMHVNIRDTANKARTALHVAALRGHEEMIRVLVDDCKADMSVEDENGDVPLNLAADSYHVNIVKFLVSRHSVRSEEVKSLLNDPHTEKYFEAVAANDIEAVKELLSGKKVVVDVRNAGDYRKTALHIAASKGYQELVEILVDEYKANINLDDEIGEYPLHNAADSGHVAIVKFLANKNSNGTEDVQDLLYT